jgi:hypothetical protein
VTGLDPELDLVFIEELIASPPNVVTAAAEGTWTLRGRGPEKAFLYEVQRLGGASAIEGGRESDEERKNAGGF